MLAFGVPKAMHPDVQKKVMDDFGTVAGTGTRENFTFNIEFPAFSAKRVAARWLRSAYLVFFATLGYRFILRRELDVVRYRIRNPEHDEPVTARIIRPEPVEPMILEVESPAVFRSYVMAYRRNSVFLPRYNDHELYQRLTEHPDTNVTFTGVQYPWPKGGPVFLHD